MPFSPGVGQTPVTAFASAARTATSTSTPIKQVGGLTADGRGFARGVLVVIDVTAVTATPSVTFAFQTAAGSGAFSSALVSPAITTVDTTTLMVVHPDVPNATANISDLGPLDTRWQILATHADADSITYSVTVFYLR